MIYKFRNGNLYHGVDAQAAGEELERIRLDNGGKLITEAVLDAASLESSPIHNVFTWDDEKAAREYRMNEARQFIKALVVVSDKADERPQPAYWNVAVSVADEQEPDRYYQSSAVIAESPLEYESALRLMLVELSSSQTRLERLRSLAPKGSKTKVMRASKFLESAHNALQ